MNFAELTLILNYCICTTIPAGPCKHELESLNLKLELESFHAEMATSTRNYIVLAEKATAPVVVNYYEKN